MPFMEEPFVSGSCLGTDAAEHVARCAEAYCAAEGERITLQNEARVNVLHAEGRDLTERRVSLVERLRAMPPPGDPQACRRRAAWYWSVGGLLAAAAFGFAIIGLD